MRLLLTHGYFLGEDPKEQAIMKPYPPLGLLYLSAHLKARGASVSVFDSTFRAFAEFERALRQDRPRVVGLYCNLMTKRTVLRMIAACRAQRIPVVLASRVGSGSVLRNTYAYPGSERDLFERGLVPAGRLDPLKARVLLRGLLAGGADRSQISTAFAVAGEYVDGAEWPWPAPSGERRP